MPSEYHKWLARNEKPAEKRELTPAEKRKNWLYYHKWHLIGGAVAVLCVISIIVSSISGKRNGPDLQIAYVGDQYLPESAIAALEKALAPYAEDITGNGRVDVYIQQYVLEADLALMVRLEADLASGGSRIFLMEDPKAFQERYGALGYADGVFAEETKRDEPLWHAWSQCPALANLELGSYVDALGQTGDCQALLSKLYIGRRGIETSYEYGDLDNRIWSQLIAGLIPEE